MIAAQTSLVDELIDNILERDERLGTTRICVPDRAGLERAIATFDDDTIYAGVDYVYLRRRNLRLILDETWPCTDAELAREYIRHLFRVAIERYGPFPPERQISRGRVPWRRGEQNEPEFKPTSFYDAELATELVDTPLAYIDINACYFELYRWWSLDTAYQPSNRNPFYGYGVMTFDRHHELEKEKGIRNCVFGSFARKHQTYASTAINPWRAVGLTRLIEDTMHAICQEIRANWKCPMILTDAFFVPLDDAETVRSYVADHWRLRTSIRAEGDAHLAGTGLYRIGNYRTAHYDTLAKAGRYGNNSSTLKPVHPAHVTRLKASRAWRAPAILTLPEMPHSRLVPQLETMI